MVREAWRFLGRMDVAGVFILLVLLLAALGSFFPQHSSAIAVDGERLARWEEALRARYGALAGPLTAIGGFRWFHSPIFLVPLALLVLATLVCTLNRWRGVWRRVFHRPLRCPDAAFDDAPCGAELNVPSLVDSIGAVREGLRRRGFHVRSESDGDAIHIRGDRHWWARPATLVTHLAVLLLLLGMMLSEAYAWREEVTVGLGKTVAVRSGSEPGLRLRSETFNVAHYADGSVAGYEVEVTVVKEGREVRHGSIRLNEPLTYDGVGFYLQSYTEKQGGCSVTLLAVHDPGFVLVIAGGFLLLLGSTVSFNFPHCCVRARLEPEEALRLAGRADRGAWDFSREFAALAVEIEQAAGG